MVCSLYVTTQDSVADGTGEVSFLFDSQVLKYDLTTGNPTDPSGNYRGLARRLMPQADIVADRFPVSLTPVEF